MPWAKTCSTALLVKSFILLPVLVISKHLKSLRVAQTLVRGRQMWPLPFWKSSWNSQLILGGHFSCPSVTVELLPRSHGSRGSWDPSTSIEDFNYPSGLTALSVPVWSFPVMFMQLLHSSTIYPPAALHSLSCVYVLWLEYFAWTFLDLPSIFTAGSHTQSINFPCCQPASHQKLSTWLPGKAWGAFFLPCCFSSLGETRSWKAAEAGAGDTTTFPDSPSLLGKGHQNHFSCLSGNNLIQHKNTMGLGLLLGKTIGTVSCKI